MQKFDKKAIVKKSENISDWYTDVILRSEMADYAPVKGCMVFRPYGFALWEAVQHFMDPLIKAHGVANAYFPLFIPESYLKREAQHVEGFAPHLAVVTIAGGEELKERLVVRPTSETIMYEMYKKWTQSYRDLPVLMNQWNNVVRWEKRTYLFMRTSEFLWQEGHCAHLTHEENYATVTWALDMYIKTYQELMGLYGIAGIKSETEKFAGGDRTLTYEILMPDGKALQACTSHDLGQNFAKAFDWTVLDKEGKKAYPWQNSWGFSTRCLGGLILVHGDDFGMVMPPKIAPIQVVIIPVKNDEKVTTFCESLKKQLIEAGLRVKVDDRSEKSMGWKFNEWELKGVPVRLEVGLREIESGALTLARRDTKEKVTIEIDHVAERVHSILHKVQDSLFEKSKQFTKDNTHDVSTFEEFKKIMSTTRGFLRAFWCEDAACEKKIKEETKASTRCLPLDAKEMSGACIYCQKPSKHQWLFAQAY